MNLVQEPLLQALRASLLPRLLPLVAAALLSAGCTADEEESPGRSIRTDSAGISVVMNYAPAWRAEEAWRVDSVPLFQVDPTLVEEAQFQQLLHVQRNSDGSVVAVDEVPPFARAFTAAGEPLWSAVREGGGPTEVRGPMLAYGMRGDTTIVEDGMGGGAALVAPDGSVATRLQPMVVMDSTGRERTVIPMLRLEDGSALAYDLRISPPDLEGTGFWTPAWNVHLFPRDVEGSVSLGPFRLQVAARVATRDAGPIALLSPWVSRAATRDGFVYGFPIRDEFSIHDGDGAVRTIVRRPTPLRLLSASEEEQARSLYEQVVAARSSPERAAQVARTVAVFDTLPAYGRMLVSKDGTIWREWYAVERDLFIAGMIAWSDSPISWDVHSEDGTWLGSVELPPRFALTSVGEDWVAGIHADENDVQTPRVYRLLRP
jgi:hypothetical protein